MTIGPWDFNYIDIVVLLVVVMSLFMAMSRGFFRELISIVALVVGAGVSLFVFGKFRGAARDFFKPEMLADLVLGAGSFLITYMLIVFILSSMSKSGKDEGISFFNRLLGGAFGALRGLIVCALAVMFLNADYSDAAVEYEEKMAQADRARQILQDTSTTDPRIIDDYKKDIAAAEALEKPELSEGFANSTLFPILDKISGPLKSVISKAKRTGQKLYEGDTEGALEEL